MAGVSCLPKIEPIDLAVETNIHNENSSNNNDSLNESCSDINTSSRPTSQNGTEDNRSRCLEDSPPRKSLEKTEAESHWSRTRVLPEMKCVRVLEKTVLQANCDMPVGRSWGPYHIACIKCPSGPIQEANDNQMIAQVAPGCDYLIGLHEDISWIKLIYETGNTCSKGLNIDIIIDGHSETVSVVTSLPISNGTVLGGTIQFIPSLVTETTVGLLASSTGGGAPKRDKKCVYCGIFFSSLDTLSAHMNNYCSRRPHLPTSSTLVAQSVSIPCSTSPPKASITPTSFSSITSNTTEKTTEPPIIDQNSAFSWPGTLSRPSPGKRIQNKHSAHASSLNIPPRHTPRHSDSPPSQLPPPFRPPDLSSIFNSSASSLLPSHLLRGSHAGLLSGSDLATLTAIASFGSRLKQPPSLPPQLTTYSETPTTPQEKTGCERRAIFCRGCQRFYASSIYHSHVGISRQLGNEAISQLSESASRLGLVLTAPLITDTGFIYIPVHPACGQRGTDSRETDGVKQCRRQSPPSPLDLRVAAATNATQDEETPKEVTKAPEAPLNMLLTLLSGLLSQSGQRGGEQEPVLSLLNSMVASNASPPWFINPKQQPPFNTAEALEGLLMQFNHPPAQQTTSAPVSSASNEADVVSSAFSHHLAAVAVEGSRNMEQLQQQQQPPRPYLCTNCQTRFQAYSTFKAHQQYYCQGRRKGVVDATPAPPVTPQISPPASIQSDRSVSPGPVKRRRLCPLSTTPGGDMERIAKENSTSDEGEPSPSPQSLRPGASIPAASVDWELCGNSELRCRLCGYVGQTPRGMKMHNRLHECSGVINRAHQQLKHNSLNLTPPVEKEASPNGKSTSSLDSNSVTAATNVSSPARSPQNFRAQPLC